MERFLHPDNFHNVFALSAELIEFAHKNLASDEFITHNTSLKIHPRAEGKHLDYKAKAFGIQGERLWRQKNLPAAPWICREGVYNGERKVSR